MSEWKLAQEPEWRLADETSKGNAFGDLMEAGLNYQKGALKGGAQKLGDIASSIGNFGLSGIEKLTGKHFDPFPHPHLLDDPVNSVSENIGRIAGQEIAPFIIPGFSGAKLASKVAHPFLKALIGAGAGALGGAAQEEENRFLGGITGAFTGSAGALAPWALKLSHALKPENVKNSVLNAKNTFNTLSGKNFKSIISDAENAGANKFLKPVSADLKKLKKAGDADYLYSLEEYNKKPTLQNAHDAQSDLNKYAASLGRPKDKLERIAIKEAKDYSEEIRRRMTEAMIKTGNPAHVARYYEARNWHKQNAVPYNESKAIKEIEKGNLRTKNFPERLMKEEKFMAKVGHHHPELLTKEKIGKALDSRAGQIATTLGIGALGGLIPYEIRKYFE